MKVELLTNILGGDRFAKVTVPGLRKSVNLVPKPEDGVSTDGELLRWLGDRDDAIREDDSDHGGIADLLRDHYGGGS